MYNPASFTVDQPAEILALLRRVGFGHLVTDADGLESTALPFVVDDDLTHVRAHFARANPHWKVCDGATALLIVPGADGYVSPQWYPSKAEHGRVVPTWNYELVHVRGTVEIHDDPAWTRRLVTDLTDHREQLTKPADGRQPWHVSDAPDPFVDGQLRAIVGVQLNVTAVEGKRKLSQNKSEGDRRGAADGLAASDDQRSREVATMMGKA